MLIFILDLLDVRKKLCKHLHNLSYKLNCKACRTAAVRKEVAAAIIKAIATGDVAKNAEISKENLVVRFGEA